MSYDLPVRRSQQIGSAFTVATLPTLSQMVGEPIGMLAYTVDGGLYAWNGTTWVAVAAGAALALGITPITGGTSGYVLYDNAGVVGELANTGTGNNVLATSPALITPSLDVATGVSLALSSATGLTLGGSVLAKTKTLLFTLLSYYIAPSSTTLTIAATGASWASGIATLTFSAITTALPIGSVITVTGMTPSGYNVTNAQITASSTTSISFAVTANPGAFSSGGTIAAGTTYTPSTGAVTIDILAVGGGGGGGGGIVSASAASGGAGGGGGCAIGKRYRVSEFGSATITLTAGGTAGGAGAAGGVGGSTTVAPSSGNSYSALGGGGGYFGGIAGNTGGGGGGSSGASGGTGTATAGGTAIQNATAGGIALTGGTVAVAYAWGGCPGSGGGGGTTTAGSNGGANSAGGCTGGGSGGATNGSNSGTGGFGQASTTAAATGVAGSNAIPTNFIAPGNGGSGGGGATTGAAGAGGSGYGGGGGGGGGSSASGTAAAGGKGGDGFVFIVEYF